MGDDFLNPLEPALLLRLRPYLRLVVRLQQLNLNVVGELVDQLFDPKRFEVQHLLSRPIIDEEGLHQVVVEVMRANTCVHQFNVLA